MLVSLIQRLAARVALPASVLLAGAGIALGTFATIVQHAEAGGVLGKFALAFSSLPIGSDAFIYILLPALLFQSALDDRGAADARGRGADPRCSRSSPSSSPRS